MDTQIITPVTNLPERVCKKRNRDAGLVCVIINQVESEYDGCFTGGIETSRGVITEVELHDNFKIDLKHQISIVQGHDMLYKPIVNNFCMRTKGFKDLDLRNEDPFCKVLVVNGIEEDSD